MKKYIKLFIFILLMIISTNVYAYNWCKGGIGENSYDICDNETYPYYDEYGTGIFYDSGITACGGGAFSQCNRKIKDLFVSNFFKNNEILQAGYNEFVYHDTPMFIIGSEYKFGNVNKFYTNKYLLNNDSLEDVYNKNVVVTTKEYKVDGETGDVYFSITRIDSPILSSNGIVIGHNYIIIPEEHTTEYVGVKINSSFSFVNAFTKDPRDWPGYIRVTNTRGLNGAKASYIYVQGQDCSSCTVYGKVPDPTPIIEPEEDPCASADKINDLIDKYLVKGLHIIAPIILLILTTLDFITGIMDKEGKGLNKAMSRFAKRALACLILFFAGNIIDMLFDLAGITKCETVDTGDIVETYPDDYFCD